MNTNLKIILLDHQNNYVEKYDEQRWKKKFDILAISFECLT